MESVFQVIVSVVLIGGLFYWSFLSKKKKGCCGSASDRKKG